MLRVAGLERCGEAKGIGWARLSADGCMAKAPLARETVGENPPTGGKTAASAICLPPALAVTGANRHDVSLLEAALDSVVIEHTGIFERPQHLCLDKGFTDEPALETVVLRGFIPHIKSRGEKPDKNKTLNIKPAGGLLRLPAHG